MSANHEPPLAVIAEAPNRELLPSLNAEMHAAAERLQDGTVLSVDEFHYLQELAEGLTKRPDGQYGRSERVDGYRGLIVDPDAAEPVIRDAKPERWVMSTEEVERANQALTAKHLGQVSGDFRAGAERLDTSLPEVQMKVRARLKLHEAAQEVIRQREETARAAQQVKNDAAMAEERRHVSEAAMANAELRADLYVSKAMARGAADRAARGYAKPSGVAQATMEAALREVETGLHEQYMRKAAVQAEQAANARERLVNANGGAGKLPAILMKEQAGVRLKQPDVAGAPSEASQPELERPSHATKAQWLRLSPLDKRRVATGAPVPEQNRGKLGSAADPEPGQSRYDLVKPDDLTDRQWHELSLTSERRAAIAESDRKKAAAAAVAAIVPADTAETDNVVATTADNADEDEAARNGRLFGDHAAGISIIPRNVSGIRYAYNRGNPASERVTDIPGATFNSSGGDDGVQQPESGVSAADSGDGGKGARARRINRLAAILSKSFQKDNAPGSETDYEIDGQNAYAEQPADSVSDIDPDEVAAVGIDEIFEWGDQKDNDSSAETPTGRERLTLRRRRLIKALGTATVVAAGIAFAIVEIHSPGTVAHMADLVPMTTGKGGGLGAHAHAALNSRPSGYTGEGRIPLYNQGHIPPFEQASAAPGAENSGTITETLTPNSNPWQESVDALHAQGVTDPTNKQILALDNQAGAHLFKQLGLKFTQSAWFEKARHLSVGLKLYFPRLR